MRCCLPAKAPTRAAIAVALLGLVHVIGIAFLMAVAIAPEAALQVYKWTGLP